MIYNQIIAQNIQIDTKDENTISFDVTKEISIAVIGREGIFINVISHINPSESDDDFDESYKNIINTLDDMYNYTIKGNCQLIE